MNKEAAFSIRPFSKKARVTWTNIFYRRIIHWARAFEELMHDYCCHTNDVSPISDEARAE